MEENQIILQDGVVNCHCIKKFEIELKLLTEDQFLIRDLSEYSGDLTKIKGKEFEVKMTTPDEEELSFLIPIAGQALISIKGKGYLCLRDGIYCFETKSCGRSIDNPVPGFSFLENKLEHLLIIHQEKQFIIDLMAELGLAKKSANYGLVKESMLTYESIKKRVEDCTDGSCTPY